MNSLFKMTENWDAVKNCTALYKPKGQALEYAPLATNPYRGCGHKCVYCYVPRVLRMDREEFDAGAKPRDGYIGKLKKDAEKYQAAGIMSRVLLSFTTDPFNPIDTSLTRETIKIIQARGMSFVTLSKGGSRAMPFMDLYRAGIDHYACTLTTLDDAESLRWESGAALPKDRIATLKAFFAAGIYTWVSLEPTLNADTAIEIVRRTHDFVNLYKVGKLNYLNSYIDWREYTARMVDMSERVESDFYFKKDLQGFLPKKFENGSEK